MAAPETVLDKLPPQNLDAEMGVLGAMLLDREAIGHAIEAITADSFYKGAHAMIFSAVVELFDANEPVDIITLSEHLKKRKELEAVAGLSDDPNRCLAQNPLALQLAVEGISSHMRQKAASARTTAVPGPQRRPRACRSPAASEV